MNIFKNQSIFFPNGLIFANSLDKGVLPENLNDSS